MMQDAVANSGETVLHLGIVRRPAGPPTEEKEEAMQEGFDFNGEPGNPVSRCLRCGRGEGPSGPVRAAGIP